MSVDQTRNGGERKHADSDTPMRQVRAQFDETTIRVYQAFSPQIADVAMAAQTFKPPFSRSRMTWIKPSFTWMMYRSGWASKPGQEHVLGIDISRRGFEWALANSCLSHFDRTLHATKEEWATTVQSTPVRIQWDPDRSISLEAMPYRTIQVGLGGKAVAAYVDEWIARIEDLTDLVRRSAALVQSGDLVSARSLLPVETVYALPTTIAHRIGIDSTQEKGR